MANPYLSNFRVTHEPPWGGTVGQKDLRRSPTLSPSTTTSKEWLSQYGPTMCQFFKDSGRKLGNDYTFTGEVTSAKVMFDRAYDAYETFPGDDVKDFAWDCFVQGFQSVRGSSYDAGSQGGGWGFLEWALVLGGLGAAGLFGYNYLRP